MESNAEFDVAWRLVEETGVNLFLTGSAGTGKTTFIRKLKEESKKRVVVTAPTGIAAINAGGVTIHSLFQLALTPFVPGLDGQGTRFNRFSREKLRVLKMMDVLVIDEISMVRCDVLDAIDWTLRRLRNREKAFGGVQLVMIGDLYQLPPVCKGEEEELLRRHYESFYFFESHALGETSYETVELTKIYRQRDERFAELLSRVRDNSYAADDLEELNKRWVKDFVPAAGEGYIRLTALNQTAREINEEELRRLGGEAIELRGKVDGEFPESSFPAEGTLTLKKGAQVMFLKNVPDRGYYNGMIGYVEGYRDATVTVRPAEGGDTIAVIPTEWENVKYTVDEESGAVKTEVQGKYTQYPLKLSWAITIHKSQGLTFDRAMIDVSNSFAHGQTYVALSRCRSLEGLVLSHRIGRQSVICDGRIAEFVRAHLGEGMTEERIEELKRAFAGDTVRELFDMSETGRGYERLHRLVEEGLGRVYADVVEQYRRGAEAMKKDVEEVAGRFRRQYEELMARAADPERDERVQERLRAGARYFGEKLKLFSLLLSGTPTNVDNAAMKKRLQTAAGELRETLRVKRAILNGVESGGFTVKRYLWLKGIALMAEGEPRKGGKRKNMGAEHVRGGERNREAYKALMAWRERRAAEQGYQPSGVTSLQTLKAIAETLPESPGALQQIAGVGKVFMKKYAREVLELLGHEWNAEAGVEETREEGKKKATTYDVTLEMWRSGKRLKEIAQERGMSAATIESHLARLVGQGQIDVTEVTTEKNYELIAGALRGEGQLLSDVMEKIGAGRVTYAEIKCVIADRNRRRQ